MELFSKEEILGADDLSFEDIPVPEWGPNKGVRLMSLTGTQRDDFEDKTVIQKGGDQKMNLINMRARLLSLCIVDANGKRIFSDVEVPLLGQKNAKILERLFDKARNMNGMTEEDVERLTEGFGDVPSEDSTSG
jgi:hypothetical protein